MMSSLDRDIAYPYASLVAMLVRHESFSAQYALGCGRPSIPGSTCPLPSSRSHSLDNHFVPHRNAHPLLYHTQVKMVMVIQSVVAGMTIARYSDGSAKVYVCAGIFVYTLAFQVRGERARAMAKARCACLRHASPH